MRKDHLKLAWPEIIQNTTWRRLKGAEGRYPRESLQRLKRWKKNKLLSKATSHATCESTQGGIRPGPHPSLRSFWMAQGFSETRVLCWAAPSWSGRESLSLSKHILGMWVMMFFHITLLLSYLMSPYSSMAFSDERAFQHARKRGSDTPPSPEEFFLTGGIT